MLFDLGPHEWLLYWKTPDPAPTRRKRRIADIMQLPLFDPLLQEKAVGADEGSVEPRPRTHLRLVKEPTEGLGTEE